MLLTHCVRVRALHLFVDAHGQLPEPGNITDAQELFDVARNLYPDEGMHDIE